MNLQFFSRFSRTRKANAVFKVIDHVRKHPVFRRARVDVYTPSLHPQRLIILLGQMHTVWKGKISNRQRRQIVNCQSRLCSYYAYFEQFHRVEDFGGEGMYDGLETSFQDHSSFSLYQQAEKQQGVSHPLRMEQMAEVARKIFADLGKQWQQALRSQQNLKLIQQLAGAINGQTLFNYLSDGKAEVYPIEGEGAYQKVLQNISHLGERIAKLEEKAAFRYVRQRGGKVETDQEAQVIKQYNALVKEFNRMIGSDIRERATMEILKEKAEQSSLVVFTMGVGHRKNYLRLADSYLKADNTAFVFVTPPELLPNWWVLLGIPVLILALLLGANFLFS